MKSNGWIKERRVVEKFSVDGSFIKEYLSLSLAAKENNISSVSITNCCRKRQKSAAGFIWKYKKTTQTLTLTA